MKKLMTALAVCTVAGFASAAVVTSANVVGYKTLDVSLGIDFSGTSFTDLSSVDGSWTFSTDIFGQPLADGDALLVFDPALYDYMTYVYGSGAWLSIDPLGNILSVPAPVKVLGDAFLFVPVNSATAYVASGQVPTNGVYATTFVASSVVSFSSKLPADVTAGEVDGFCGAGDAILVFDPTIYDYNIYVFDAAGGVIKIDPLGNITGVNLTDVVLPVGQGGLYSNAGTTVVWNQTIAL